MGRCLLSIAVVVACFEQTFAQEINPAGMPEQDLVKVTNARYFVWHDAEGWHLRSAAKGTVRFVGSISLKEGSFGKLRTVGLERRGRYPDRWDVNGERDKLVFELFTGGSFDGFDFDVRGSGATIEYELKIGKNASAMPKRIFIGRDNAHPEEIKFSFPADPAN